MAKRQEMKLDILSNWKTVITTNQELEFAKAIAPSIIQEH